MSINPKVMITGLFVSHFRSCFSVSSWELTVIIIFFGMQEVPAPKLFRGSFIKFVMLWSPWRERLSNGQGPMLWNFLWS